MKVIVDDCLYVHDKMIKYIDDACPTIEAVSKSVADFIGDSKSDSNLQGEDFDKVRYHMQAYCDVLDYAKKSLIEWKDYLQESNNNMENFAKQNVWEDAPTDDYDRLGYVIGNKLVWQERYLFRNTNKCTKGNNSGHMVTVTSSSYDPKTKTFVSSTSEVVCSASIHQNPEVDEAKTKRDFYTNWYNHLSQLPDKDNAYFEHVNSYINNVINTIDSKNDEIIVMTISDAINEIANNDKLSDDEKIKSILSSVSYPSWINESTLASQTSGYFGQWKSYLTDNFGSEYWKSTAEKYNTDFTGALISDFKSIPEAFKDLGAVIIGKYQ